MALHQTLMDRFHSYFQEIYPLGNPERMVVLNSLLITEQDRVEFKERYKYSTLTDYFADNDVLENTSDTLSDGPLPEKNRFVSSPDAYDYIHTPDSNTILVLPQGVEVGSLTSLLAKHAELEQAFTSYLVSGNDVFADLNLTFFTKGIGVYVPSGVQADKPIRIIYRMPAGGSHVMERSAIFIGDSAKADVWWVTESSGNEVSVGNNVCHVRIGKGARLEFLETYCLDTHSVYLHHNYVDQQADSVMRHHILSLGAKAIRHNHNVKMSGPFSRNESRGLCVSDGTTHSDVDIRMEHTAPDCVSNQLYKQILDGESTGVFSGRILIPKDSQRTLAYQKSNNIQLDRRSKMRTRPQLEIYADDVKCSHGATVGQLDTDAIFYLRSRGIGEQEARRLLLGAFASEVFSDIENESLSASLMEYAIHRIPLLYDL